MIELDGALTHQAPSVRPCDCGYAKLDCIEHRKIHAILPSFVCFLYFDIMAVSRFLELVHVFQFRCLLFYILH